MICEKCGKSNPGGIGKCTYCGADMPENFNSSGFADILTKQYTESASSYPTTERISDSNSNMGVNEEDMKQILNNSEMTLKAAKKSSALAMMAVILCALTLACSIVFGVMILSKGTSEQEPSEENVVEKIDNEKGQDDEIPAPENDEKATQLTKEELIENAENNVIEKEANYANMQNATEQAQEAVVAAEKAEEEAKAALDAAEIAKKDAEDAYIAATDAEKAELENNKNTAQEAYDDAAKAHKNAADTLEAMRVSHKTAIANEEKANAELETAKAALAELQESVQESEEEDDAPDSSSDSADSPQ